MSEQQVPEGTVAEVLDWVGDDPGRARAALDAERTGANRSSLINQIEPIANRPEGSMESTSITADQDEVDERSSAATDTEGAQQPTTGSELDRVQRGDEGDEGYDPLEDNAPGPERPDAQDIEIDPRDRAVWVGPANARHDEVDLPDDRYDLAAARDPEDDDVALGPDPAGVDYFQVMSLGGVVVIRADDQAILFDRDQSMALSRDLRQAMANVTY